MKKLHNIHNINWFPLYYLGALTISLLNFYSDGNIILGGESNVCLDYGNLLRHHGIDYLHNSIGINIWLPFFIQKLTHSLALTNFLPILCLFYLPFLAMYFLAKEFTDRHSSTLIALFYVLNPFSYGFLGQLLGGTAVLIFLPIAFLLILQRRIILFGLVASLMAFVFSNPPLFIISLIAIFLMAFYAYGPSLRKIFFVFFSFTAFNLWWIYPFLREFEKAKSVYSTHTANLRLHETLAGMMNWASTPLTNTLLFKGGLDKDQSYSFLAMWFNMPYSSWFLIIPVLAALSGVIYAKKWNYSKIFSIVVGSAVLMNPATRLFQWAYLNVPFFNIFKSPSEKFGVLFLLFFCVLLALGMKKGWQKYLFSIYVVFCAVPLLTGNLIPDYNSKGLTVTRKYFDKQEYKDLREYLNLRRGTIVSFPGNYNYQVCFKQGEKFYTGLDPILTNTNRDFLNSWIDSKPYQNLNRSYYQEKGYKVLINEDLFPWFGTVEKEGVEQLKSFFGSFMKAKKFGNLTYYE